MKVLVTGGCGFIGSHLVDKLLSYGHKVKVIDNLSTGRYKNLEKHSNNRNLAIFELDINQTFELVEHLKDIDWVFHLGALADIVPSIKMPEKYFKSNVDGTLSVLEAAKMSKVKRFIYAASSSCYGIPNNYPTKETSKIDTKYPYALTKYLGEEMVIHWGKVYKLPVVSLRLFNVYGTRSRTSGTYGAVLGTFLAQKIAGKPFTVVGDGKQTRDFVYVTDVAEAFITAAESGVVGEVYNVGSGGTYSINSLVKLLGGEVTYIPKRPGEPDCTFADIGKIKSEIGWNPKISFETGIRMILDEIDYWKEAPVWTPETIETQTKDWFRYLGKVK